MGDRLANINDDLIAACRAGADEAAKALARALGGDFALTVGDPSQLDAAEPLAGFDGPGLAVLFRYGDEGLAILAPAASAWLPPWCAAPDATGHSKLQTLAQELSVTLAPESLSADETTAGWVANLGEALRASQPSETAGLITLTATTGEHSAPLCLVWPLAAPQKVLGAEPAVPRRPASRAKKPDLSTLPAYARSLLKIRVPVSVQLATRKESVHEIVGLAPGAIVKFEKGCDELLQMVVGGNAVAEGEAVKIGDKFGFRITSMLLPQEHFVKVKRPQAG